MDLEEHSLDPVIEHTCEECGARLTDAEIKAALDSGGRFLCAVHAAEEVPLDDEVVKREFWQAFRSLGDWYEDFPPY